MRTIILVMALLLEVTLLFGQVSFGLKGGVNLNGTSVDGGPTALGNLETKSTMAFHVGVFSTIGLSENFYLIPELQYIQKGYKTSYSSKEDKSILSYVEILVLVGFYPIKRLGIELGPTAGLNVSAKVKRQKDITVDIKEIIEPFEMGLIGGIRYDISDKVSATVRYFRGLTQTSRYFFTEDGVNGILSKFYNRSVQFSTYYVVR